MHVQIKRAYEPPRSADGYRVLVDRLWPRGLTKRKLRVDAWLKEVAPSAHLRRWIRRRSVGEFRRYFKAGCDRVDRRPAKADA
jgi:uncharacterized protein YeaO (DUF488 family)